MTWAVFVKELIDGLRDGRSVVSACLFPLVAPLILGITLSIVADWQRTDRTLELPVVGAEHAPSLVNWLEEQGVVILPAPDDAEAEVREGGAAAVLVIQDSFERDFRAARPAGLQLFVDDSRNKTRSQTYKVQNLLAAYSAQLGSLRLLARGVSPEIATPLLVEKVDLATPERLAATLLNALPLFLVMAVFMGGMNLAIDTTAGERERGSLEPLLINPVSRAALVGGKWAATTVFSVAVLAMMVAGVTIMTNVVSFEGLGVDLRVGLRESASMFLSMLPLAPLAAILQIYVATFARSFKEAQAYISLLLFVPVLPAVFLSLQPLQPEGWMMLVPALSQIMLVTEIMAGEPAGLLAQLGSAVSALVVAGLVFRAAAGLLRRERIIFGR